MHPPKSYNLNKLINRAVQLKGLTRFIADYPSFIRLPEEEFKSRLSEIKRLNPTSL